MAVVTPWTVIRWSVSIHCHCGHWGGGGFWKARASDLGEFPRQDGGNGRRAQGRREDEQPHSFTLGPCPVFILPNLDPATLALTFTSSANLLPALRGSSKQLPEGPREQQHKSRLPGLPPRGKSQPGLRVGEAHWGPAQARASFLRGDERLCVAVWHSIPRIRPTA